MKRTVHVTALLLALAAAWNAEAQATSNGGGARGSARTVTADRGGKVDPTAIPRPSLRAIRATGLIKVDGNLDEVDWALADSTTTDFIQILPNPGYPASEQTVVRILYDDRNLYIGATLYEAEPEKLIVPGLEQDFTTHDADILAIAIDTYHDKSNGFLWAVNPAGAIYDAQAFDDTRNLNVAWEGVVYARTSVGTDRWIVEMAIPFTTLRYDPSKKEQTWGLAFARRLRHLNEESNWAPTERQYKIYNFSLAGTLTGLENLKPVRNLTVKPYLLGARSSGALDASEGSTANAGFDAKWGLTPRLTLDLTALTDFSQVDVDEEQVNLTRFSLFFPEKRDFFLENDGMFAFQDVTMRSHRMGSSSRSFKLFHSRRIGLSNNRTPIPITAGARLTGKIGKSFEVGFLNMQTRSDGTVAGGNFSPAENDAVARVRAMIGTKADIGAMFVNRQVTAGSLDGFNRSVGLDGNVLLFGNNLVLSAYAAHTDERHPTGDRRDALMAQASWRDPLWDVSVLTKQIGDDFNPGLGFVDRVGVRRLFTTIGVHPQFRGSRVFEVNPYVNLDVYTNFEGAMESRSVIPAVAVTFRDGGILEVQALDRYERLFAATTVAGARVKTGTYAWREALASYTVAGAHRISGVFGVSGGDFYDGSRLSLSAATTLRLNEHYSMDLVVQRNDLNLGGKDFTADIYSAQARWARNVRTFLMGFVQYNKATNEVISNARFDLIHAPLSDLFVVFTERRSLAHGVANPVLERGITLKVTNLLAF